MQYISSVTTKGQVTIPAEIRRLLKVMPHDKVAFVVEADQVRVVSAKSVVARTAGMLGGEEEALAPQLEKRMAEDTMAEAAYGARAKWRWSSRH